VTNSVVFRGKSGTIRFLKTAHFFEKTPDYT
jgi:fructose-1,6-bisphosphatase/sedoheptulose 1,7-bisphosphatase-like protein